MFASIILFLVALVGNTCSKHYLHNVKPAIKASRLPLSTISRWIIGADGKRVKLACVNWYGAEEEGYVVGGLQWQTIDYISSLIHEYRFNCIRLPFSLELIDKNPIINQTKIKSEPSLYGSHALTVLDAVVNTITNKYGIMIILDNHMSDANWCCSNDDGNGLWYTDTYSQSQWLSYWEQIVTRYKDNKYVVGVDLRNELRETKVNGKTLTPSWGDGNTNTDWREAAILCANTIQKINPNLLMIVEGIDYALNLKDVYNHPILNSDLLVPNKLVYSTHDYSWSQNCNSYNDFKTTMGDNWGYILAQNKTYTAPVWMGEFGECHSNTGNCLQSNWWLWMQQYLSGVTNADIPWSYWAIDGTESEGKGRTYGSEETFGILNTTWNGLASSILLQNLQSLINATQGPNY